MKGASIGHQPHPDRRAPEESTKNRPSASYGNAGHNCPRRPSRNQTTLRRALFPRVALITFCNTLFQKDNRWNCG
jgi:hypothetical protein